MRPSYAAYLCHIQNNKPADASAPTGLLCFRTLPEPFAGTEKRLWHAVTLHYREWLQCKYLVRLSMLCRIFLASDGSVKVNVFVFLADDETELKLNSASVPFLYSRADAVV